jgi:hypothetical protein
VSDAFLTPALIPGVLAVVLTAVSFGTWLARRRFLSRCVKVEGVVAAHEQRTTRRRNRRHVIHVPVVEYRVNGRVLRVTGTVGASTPRHPVGAVVPVFYAPQQPAEAVVGTWEENWFLPLLFGVFAVTGWLVLAVVAFGVGR